MGLERFKECVEHLNYELQSGEKLIVPEADPLHVAQEAFTERLKYLFEEWPAQVLNDDHILATVERLGIRQNQMPTEEHLRAMLRECLVVRWPRINVAVNVGPSRRASNSSPNPPYMSLAFRTGPSTTPSATLTVEMGKIWTNPFKALQILLSGASLFGQLAIPYLAQLVVILEILHQLIKVHPFSPDQRKVIVNLVGAKNKLGRDVSTLEVAANELMKSPRSVLFENHDFVPLQGELQALVEANIATKSGEVIWTAMPTQAQISASRKTRDSVSVAPGQADQGAEFPESGVWDTSTTRLEVLVRLYLDRGRTVKAKP